jgi:hypothetical protein
MLPDKMTDRISIEKSGEKIPRTTDGLKIQLNKALSRRLNQPKKSRKTMSSNAQYLLSTLASAAAYAGIVAAICLTINTLMQKSDTQIASELSDRCYEVRGQKSKTCSISNFL